MTELEWAERSRMTVPRALKGLASKASFSARKVAPLLVLVNLLAVVVMLALGLLELTMQRRKSCVRARGDGHSRATPSTVAYQGSPVSRRFAGRGIGDSRQTGVDLAGRSFFFGNSAREVHEGKPRKRRGRRAEVAFFVACPGGRHGEAGGVDMVNVPARYAHG